jgi:hypothetical protein
MQVPTLQHESPSSKAMTKKISAKKSTCFSSNAKYAKRGSTPTSAAAFMNGGDYALQSTDIRRRYMRRGSKAPTMMHLSNKDRAQIEESCCYENIKNVNTFPINRRLSLMSLLNGHFDQVTIVDNPTSTINF